MRTAGLLVLVVSACLGQWVERTVWLPDSLSGLTEPRCLLYVPERGVVYAGGGENDQPANGLIAIDAASRRKVAQAMLPGVAWDLAYYPAGSKLYVAADSLRILDAETHQLAGLVPGFRRPTSLALSVDAHKLYALSGDNLYIVDCLGDTLLTWFEVGAEPSDVCYNPVRNKIYTANKQGASVTVVDCTADTIVAVVRAADAPMSLVCNPSGDRLYCCCSDGDEVTVIDCSSDTVVARLDLEYAWSGAYNPVAGRAYFSTEVGLAVIDGAGDSVLTLVPAGVVEAAVCCSPQTDRVYATRWSEGAVSAFDCRGDSLVTTLPATRGAEVLCLDSAGPAVYCASASDRLTVVDARADTLLAELDCGPLYPARLLADQGEGKVYVTTDGLDWIRADTAILVVDAVGCSLAGFLDVRSEPSAMVLNALRSKLYVALDQGRTSGRDSILAVFDTRADTLLGIVEVGTGPVALALDSLRDKVFCATEDGLRMVDCGFDSVVAELTLQLEHLLSVPELGKVFGTAGGSAMAVLDAEADTLIIWVGTGGSGAGPMCYSTLEQKVYCCHLQSGNVAVIDAVRNVRVANVPSGRSPADLCYNSLDNRVYCANRGSTQEPDSTVTVIDCRADSVLATVVVGRRPTAVLFNRLNDKVYCVCEDDDVVAVIDGRTNAVVARLASGDNPTGLTWLAPMNRTFVSNLYGSSITVLRDSLAPGVAEKFALKVDSELDLSTILRGPELARLECRVIDALGRDVTDRRERLAPGVYFVGEGSRSPGFKGSRMTKVIVQR